MSLKKFVLAEAEAKGLVKKFESLEKDIKGSIEDIEKYLKDENVVDSGNANLVAQMNKVKGTLEDSLKEITKLVELVSEKQPEPEKQPNKRKMEDYLIKG